VAVGTVVGGIFVADPIDTPQDQLSTSGTLHGLGAGLALGDDGFGPDTPIGWPERILVLLYATWQITAARTIGRTRLVSDRL
jgi:hypothetical protein